MGYEYIKDVEIEEKLGEDEKPLTNEQLTIEVFKLRKKVRDMGWSVDSHGSSLGFIAVVGFIAILLLIGNHYFGPLCN
jgi:hypothetical protein